MSWFNQLFGDKCLEWEEKVYETGGEPKAAFWKELGCRGKQVELGIGNYPSLNYLESGKISMGNSIQSAYIPPHMKAKLMVESGCKDYPLSPCAGANMWDFSGGLSDLGPGRYSSIPGHAGGANKADAIILQPRNTNMNWDDFLDQCCRGVSGEGVTVDTCGPYWRVESEENTGYCDARVLEYCEVNPNDSYCACYKKPLTITASEEPGCKQIAPQCFSSECASGIAYKPSSRSKLGCLNCTVCRQSIDIQGSNNIFTNNIMVSACGTTNEPGETESVINADSTTIQGGNVIGGGTEQDAINIIAAREAAKAEYQQRMIVIFLITLITFAIIWNYSGSEPPPPRYGPPRYGPPQRGRFE